MVGYPSAAPPEPPSRLSRGERSTIAAPTDELSTALRRLRRDANLSGMEAAGQAGFSQPKISRFETGRQVPTPAEVRTLCKVYKARAEVRRRLLDLVNDLRQETKKARTVLARGASRLQKRIGRIEESSAMIRSFHPGVVPGLLQTVDYARTIANDGMDEEQLEAFVAARLARQTSVLGSERDVHVVLTEGPLRWHIGSPLIMAAQLDRLAAETHRPNLRLGVITWTTPVTMQVLHGFHIYDQRVAIIGTETATAFIIDPQDIADYEGRFAAFAEAAVYGAQAKNVFDRIAAEYRALTVDASVVGSQPAR